MKYLIGALLIATLGLSLYNYNQSEIGQGKVGKKFIAAGDAIDEDALRALIREEVEKNPDIVINAIENYRVEQQAKQQGSVKETFEELKDSQDFPIVGDTGSDVTVVEFFDYNCGACRIMAETIQESKDAAKYVLIDFPILSPGSRLAAKGSYAAKKIGKYQEYHFGLLGGNQPIQTEKDLMQVVEKVGIDKEAFEKEYNSQAADAYVQSALALASRLNLNSTPSLIVNGRLIVSAMRKPQFDALLKQVRAE